MALLLQTILWTEPERVATGTYIATNFPAWVVGAEDYSNASSWPPWIGLFNLGIPAVRSNPQLDIIQPLVALYSPLIVI
eukprot:COSAG04_NODE_18_length_39571_cov_50.788128_11_plen_79_part_00